MLIGVLLLGCPTPPDPELVRARDSLAAWRDGERAMSAGHPSQAGAAFARAYGLRPDPVLAAWQGEAAIAAGEREAAIGFLRLALEGDPGLAAARWRLALELARSGDHAAAGPELERALRDGAGRAVDVRVDPDWQPFLGEAPYAFVPASVVELTAEPLPETTFWGSDVAVTLRAQGRLGAVATFSGAARGPVELRSVVETLGPSERTLVATWRVVGAGPITLGPFTVVSEGSSATTPAVATVASAPPGKEVPRSLAQWELVSSDAITSGRAADGVVWVAVEGGERVEARAGVDQVRVEQRSAQSARAWVGLRGLGAGDAYRVGRGSDLREVVAP